MTKKRRERKRTVFTKETLALAARLVELHAPNRIGPCTNPYTGRIFKVLNAICLSP